MFAITQSDLYSFWALGKCGPVRCIACRSTWSFRVCLKDCSLLHIIICMSRSAWCSEIMIFFITNHTNEFIYFSLKPITWSFLAFKILQPAHWCKCKSTSVHLSHLSILTSTCHLLGFLWQSCVFSCCTSQTKLAVAWPALAVTETEMCWINDTPVTGTFLLFLLFNTGPVLIFFLNQYISKWTWTHSSSWHLHKITLKEDVTLNKARLWSSNWLQNNCYGSV